MLQNGCRGAFMEAELDENGNQKLSDETVHYITDKIMEFIDSKYSIYKWEEVEEVCKAAVRLFPYIALVGEHFLYWIVY